MHASIWRFTGDTEDLTRRYDALLDELPTAEFSAHLCLRAPDGILIVDTCPTRAAFQAFATSDEFRSALRRHGLPDPTELHDYPVHGAFINGATPIVDR
jgi:hypothetical protein